MSVTSNTPRTIVAVVGYKEERTGKSTIINQLLNLKLLPTPAFSHGGPNDIEVVAGDNFSVTAGDIGTKVFDSADEVRKYLRGYLDNAEINLYGDLYHVTVTYPGHLCEQMHQVALCEVHDRTDLNAKRTGGSPDLKFVDRRDLVAKSAKVIYTAAKSYSKDVATNATALQRLLTHGLSPDVPVYTTLSDEEILKVKKRMALSGPVSINLVHVDSYDQIF